MPSDTFSVTFATKDTECAGQVFESPLTLSRERIKLWDTF
jgi:hypothetical protein